MNEQASKPLTLGTAGHVDHGKTALIEALTGKNTDRLPEERRRGLSIELGFAELRLANGTTLSVVDVPGHERFVRTMVAGATGIDLFLMVVAADDGVMPQTREHLTVLKALGVEAGVVALTKCDLADPDSGWRAAASVCELMPDAPLVEVSARTGRGVSKLLEALAAVTDRLARSESAPSPWPSCAALLHVDRVFTLRGIGTVVTGTLWSGQIERGDRVEVLPSGKVARVRSVQVHGQPRERAETGERVALNLSGVERREMERGAVVAATGSGLRSTYRLDVELHLDQGVGEVAGKRVQVHLGTSDTAARLVNLDEQRQLAQLRLEAPLVARAGDRFVIRRVAPPDTLGGGVVLDAHPRRHGPRAATERLRLIREGEPEELLEAGLQECENGFPANPEAWASTPLLAAARHRYSPARWREGVANVVERGRGVTVSARLMLPEAAKSGDPGGPWQDTSRRTLTAKARQALKLLEQDGSRPTALQNLAESLELERRSTLELLEDLTRAGLVVHLPPGIYCASTELARLRERILGLIRERGSISIAELRDALGTGRKYAQALLEHLDATEQTVRQGDRHLLRRHRV
jgi:selenocysteine-specific elongation factor